jgi:integrase/recombinase XerD
MSTVVTAAGLAQDVQDFLSFKRAMGLGYLRAEFTLDGFVRFVLNNWGEHGRVALDEAVMRWTSRIAGRKAITVSAEFGTVRQLCLYRRRRDPTSYVPEHALAPVKDSIFLPYIFTHNEVRRLLAAATAHKGTYIWGAMLRALILVLYCTGMRLGEAVRLNMADINLNRGTIMIHRSKRRSRIVAIRADLVGELRRYCGERRQLVDEAGHEEPATLFVRRDTSPLTLKSASEALRRLLRELGIKPPTGRIGPRPYELRHAFAVHRLTAWAIEGVDVHAKLPWLSAYLGHLNVLGTEVYLKATPQLLELASGRFEDHLRRSRRPR